MAAYAPANSLLYLEANQPSAVVEAISGTEAWKLLADSEGLPKAPPRRPWLQGFVRWTGIGSIESVMLARSQVAVVVTDLGATEEADTLRVRPEVALIIESHTSEVRIRSTVESRIRQLAETTYDKPTLRRTSIDGVDFDEWTAPEGSRQIVAAISGSLIIIGNNRRAVQNCLAVARARGPSLKDDSDLQRARAQIAGSDRLTFGYVPTQNSARLFSIGIPLLLGRAPGNNDFQKLIATGAVKIFGSLAWTSQAHNTAIEDRYLVSLKPSVITQLKPSFISATSNPPVPPAGYDSASYYRFRDPHGAWQSLKTTVSTHVDALSAALFSAVLKSALLPYGIEEPELFLQTLGGNVLTVRLDETGERSMLLAHVRDHDSLRGLITGAMRFQTRTASPSGVEVFQDSQGEIAAALTEDLVVIGPRLDVAAYVDHLQRTAGPDDNTNPVMLYGPLSTSAPIITYTNDAGRIRSFVVAILAFAGSSARNPERIDQIIASLPYSATETTLNDHGIERVTRSPLGQFSTLLPLLAPEDRSATNRLPSPNR
ncbi:MAG: hypothetical protein M3539_07410 [Acidobacteriota bacterium]|nr:hypothetical protein [Acidobacteriota bacterium]